MKKHLLLIAALCLGMASCGGSSDSKAEPETLEGIAEKFASEMVEAAKSDGNLQEVVDRCEAWKATLSTDDRLQAEIIILDVVTKLSEDADL